MKLLNVIYHQHNYKISIFFSHSLDKNDPSTPPNCPVSEWSEWSPCSVTCGSGKRDRVREIVQETEPSPVREDVNQNLLFSTVRFL